MTHQHKIGYSVEISGDATEQPLHNLKLFLLCNRPGKYQSTTIESVSTQTNKKWQKLPLPYLQLVYLGFFYICVLRSGQFRDLPIIPGVS